MKINNNKIYNLSVEEAYKLLNSTKMAKNRCNLEIYTGNSTTPGNNHGGRKPGSKNRMTLAKLSVTVNGLTKTVNDLAKRLDQLTLIVQEGFARQEQFNNYVLDQFKKHGWVK